MPQRATERGLPPPVDGNRPVRAGASLSLGEVMVQPTRQSVRWADQSRRLTPTEWQLLLFFLGNPGETYEREQVAAGAWGDAYQARHSEVEVYVSRLRRKLGPAAARLETVRGRGYRLVLPAPGEAEVVVAGVHVSLADLERLNASMEDVLGSVVAMVAAVDDALTGIDTIA